jgi:hypothetical protein
MQTARRYFRNTLPFGGWYALPVDHLSVPAFGNDFLAVAVQAFVILPPSTFSSTLFSNIGYGWISTARCRSCWNSVIHRFSRWRFLARHCFPLTSRIIRANVGLYANGTSANPFDLRAPARLRHGSSLSTGSGLNVFGDAALPTQQLLSGTVRLPRLAARSVHLWPYTARWERHRGDGARHPDTLRECLPTSPSRW